MADGGKRDDGMLKENKARSPVVRPVSVLGVATSGDVSAEKKVRRIGKKIRQKRTMSRRGGRMSLIDGFNHYNEECLDRRYLITAKTGGSSE